MCKITECQNFFYFFVQNYKKVRKKAVLSIINKDGRGSLYYCIIIPIQKHNATIQQMSCNKNTIFWLYVIISKTNKNKIPKRCFKGVSVMYFYQRIKDLREDADLTQTQVAEYLGMKQQQYARYESGVQEIPLHHLVTLARYYNCSLDYLAGLIDIPRKLQ